MYITLTHALIKYSASFHLISEGLHMFRLDFLIFPIALIWSISTIFSSLYSSCFIYRLFLFLCLMKHQIRRKVDLPSQMYVHVVSSCRLGHSWVAPPIGS